MAVNDCLANGGTLVAFGVMSGGPGLFFTAPNIFRDLTLKGFWLLNWFNKNPTERVVEVQKKMAGWIARRHTFHADRSHLPAQRVCCRAVSFRERHRKNPVQGRLTRPSQRAVHGWPLLFMSSGLA